VSVPLSSKLTALAEEARAFERSLVDLLAPQTAVRHWNDRGRAGITKKAAREQSDEALRLRRQVLGF
jgi:hypothetical protein